MIKKILIFALFLFYVFIANSQQQIKVIEDSLFSKNLNAFSKFNIILPENYSSNNERYPTLYLLHGYSGGQNDWISKTQLIKYVKNYKLIIVTPDGKNSWYSNSPNLKNRNYEDLIAKELIPYIENKYRSLSDRHGRAIAGLSMGGYGAMKFALKYPNLFFYAASMSGAFLHPTKVEDYVKNKSTNQLDISVIEAFGENNPDNWKKNDIFYMIDSLSLKNLPYLYVSVGKDDYLVEANRTLSEKLRKKGYLYEYHELPGVHNWVFWDKEIEVILRKISKFDPLGP